jgi:hypothetical protein
MTVTQTIGLADLTALGDYQTRRDRKYLVPRGALADLLEAMPPAFVLDIGGTTAFPYESVYFDTAELTSYSDAAKRRPRRFKVRTRSYLASEACMLEVKVRDGRGRTVKHRTAHPIDRRSELTAGADDFVRSASPSASRAGAFRASLVTSYQRSTFLLQDLHARVTVDVDLHWSTDARNHLELPDVAIIETKTAGHPCAFDRELWRRGHRPSTVSKYCTGLAALRPTLPANKWHRVLSSIVWPLASDDGASAAGAPPPEHRQHLDLDEIDPSLRHAVARLAARHRGLRIEEVVAVVHDSFERLAARATISTYLPILVERDAGARLSDLEQWPAAGR